MVVINGAQEADDAQLDHQGVDNLLRLALRDAAGLQVALEVNIEEGGKAADGHGGAVLGFHGGEVCEIGPLHRFLGGGGGLGNVEPVFGGHGLELLEGLDLLSMFLAVAGPMLGERLIDYLVFGGVLFRNQSVHTVERHPTIIADNAAPPIGVRQARHDVGGAGGADTRGVNIKDRIVMGLAIFGKDLLDAIAGFLARLTDGGFHHAPAAVWHHGAFERDIGLQAHDNIIIGADITRRKGIDISRGLGIHVIHAVRALFGQVLGFEVVPHAQGFVSGAGEEGCISLIRSVITLNKIADINGGLPWTGSETFPSSILRHCISKPFKCSFMGLSTTMRFCVQCTPVWG